MLGTLSLITAPTVEPVSLEEAKSHLRVTSNTEDGRIEILIAAARGHVEATTHRQLVTATWDLILDDCPRRALELRPAPLRSVTHLKYLDSAGDEQTLASTVYRVVAGAAKGRVPPGKLSLAYGQSWPVVYATEGAVTIRVVAGYSDPAEADAKAIRAAVPGELRQAVLILLAEMYEHPEMSVVGNIINEVPFAAESLMAPFVITRW